MERVREETTLWGEPVLGKTQTRRQHFVPRSYLKNFAMGDGKIRVVDLQENREYVSSLKNVAVETRFYDVAVEGHDYSAEDWLAKLESDTSSILQALLEDPSAIVMLTDEQENTLSRFVAALSIRTPSLRQSMNDIFEDVSSQIDQKAKDFFLHQLGEARGLVKYEEWKARPFRERFNEEAPAQPASITNFLLGEVQGFANLLRAAPWRLGNVIGRLRFYASDNPVSHYVGPLRPWWGRMGFASFHYYMPLSPKLLFKIERRPDRGDLEKRVNPRGKRRKQDFSEWETSMARHIISRDASRYLYGSNPVVSKQCAESCLDRIEWDMREFAARYLGYTPQTNPLASPR